MFQPYFGMFSDKANIAVACIVDYHRTKNSPWSVVYQNLQDLAASNPELYGEATDTMVREMVYDALGLTEDFYV